MLNSRRLCNQTWYVVNVRFLEGAYPVVFSLARGWNSRQQNGKRNEGCDEYFITVESAFKFSSRAPAAHVEQSSHTCKSIYSAPTTDYGNNKWGTVQSKWMESIKISLTIRGVRKRGPERRAPLPEQRKQPMPVVVILRPYADAYSFYFLVVNNETSNLSYDKKTVSFPKDFVPRRLRTTDSGTGRRRRRRQLRQNRDNVSSWHTTDLELCMHRRCTVSVKCLAKNCQQLFKGQSGADRTTLNTWNTSILAVRRNRLPRHFRIKLAEKLCPQTTAKFEGRPGSLTAYNKGLNLARLFPTVEQAVGPLPSQNDVIASDSVQRS